MSLFFGQLLSVNILTKFKTKFVVVLNFFSFPTKTEYTVHSLRTVSKQCKVVLKLGQAGLNLVLEGGRGVVGVGLGSEYK